MRGWVAYQRISLFKLLALNNLKPHQNEKDCTRFRFFMGNNVLITVITTTSWIYLVLQKTIIYWLFSIKVNNYLKYDEEIESMFLWAVKFFFLSKTINKLKSFSRYSKLFKTCSWTTIFTSVKNIYLKIYSFSFVRQIIKKITKCWFDKYWNSWQ